MASSSSYVKEKREIKKICAARLYMAGMTIQTTVLIFPGCVLKEKIFLNMLKILNIAKISFVRYNTHSIILN